MAFLASCTAQTDEVVASLFTSVVILLAKLDHLRVTSTAHEKFYLLGSIVSSFSQLPVALVTLFNVVPFRTLSTLVFLYSEGLYCHRPCLLCLLYQWSLLAPLMIIELVSVVHRHALLV